MFISIRARACAPLALALCAAITPPALALDMETALQEVLSANPMLVARAAMTDAAHHRIAPAGAWTQPMLEVGLVNVPSGGWLYEDEMTMRMIGLEQRVPIFGSKGLAREAAREAWQADLQAGRAQALDMLGMAWERYADAYYADQLARLGLAHRGVMDRMVAAADTRYRTGRGRLDEVLRAQADRARLAADVAAFQSQARGARARLAALRGREAGGAGDSLLPPPDALQPEGSPAWTTALDGTQPKLVSLEREAAGRRAAARSMRRMTWPDLDLRASWAKRGPIQHDLGHGTELDDMWSASVGLMLPIFSGSRERAQAAEMDAMALAADGEHRAAALDLAADLDEARSRAESARRTAALLADTVVVAQQRSLDAAWIGYEAGTLDLSRVLESAHALYGEHVALLRARQEFSRACARVLAITGKGELVGVNLPAFEEGESR